MSTTPPGSDDADRPRAPDPYRDEWEDEWDPEAWHELNLADRRQRNADTWGAWFLRLAAVAIVVPLILGILAWLLILVLSN